MTHPIPPITDSLGRYWEQPPRDEVAIGTHTASMHQDTFKQLHEYSASLPTGTYVGKMWKAHVYNNIGQLCWELRWYDVHADPKYLSIKTRRILIIDEPNIAQVLANLPVPRPRQSYAT